MRVATICPTCATYSNALCTLYNGNTLPNTQILPLDSLQTALIKIDNTFSTNRFNPAANETISGNWSFINGFQVTGEVSFDNGAVTTNGSGSLTAARFIKTGGTSSEVLMADGSTSTLPSGFNPAADETITGDWAFTGDFSVGDSASGTGFAIDRANGVTSIGDWQNGNNGTFLQVDDNAENVQLWCLDWNEDNPMASFEGNGYGTLAYGNISWANDGSVVFDAGQFNTDGSGNVNAQSLSTPSTTIDVDGALLSNAYYISGSTGAVSFDNNTFTSDGSGNLYLNSISTPSWNIDQYGNFSGSANFADSAGNASILSNIWGDDGTYLNSSGYSRGISTAYWSIDESGNFNGVANTANYLGQIWYDDGTYLNSNENHRGIFTPNWNISQSGAVYFDENNFHSDGSGNVTLNNLKSATIGALNFANDTAAAAGGVPVGGIYNTAGVLKIRLT